MESNFIETYLESISASEKRVAISKLSEEFNLTIERATEIYNRWRRVWCNTSAQ